MKNPSFARIHSAQPFGITGTLVSVEVDVVPNTLYQFTIIGVPDKAVEESRDRVGTALRNSGMPSPKHGNQKTVVSLVPAELRKEGSYYDVAIAIGFLKACKHITVDTDTSLFLGELSLDGELQPLRGVLPLVVAARDAGMTHIYVPEKNKDEAVVVPGVTVFPVASLRDLVAHIDPVGYQAMRGDSPQPKEPVTLRSFEGGVVPRSAPVQYPDMNTIKGQESAKRAALIAAAGGHSIALYGPPGTGKTMLARAFTGLLPELSPEESITVTSIHSVSGTLVGNIITQPPFRSPHHTASYVALVGGGTIPKPGEITLAHHGVLFLDEFPEFDSKVLEALRQPLEDRIVTVSRARGTLQFPAQFLLVAALNPCPCGYAGSREKKCICNDMQLKKYRKKLSGPLVDRIDIWVPVEHLEYTDLHKDGTSGESSETIRHSVSLARTRALERSHSFGTAYPNSCIKPAEIELLQLAADAKDLMIQSAQKLTLSPRGYHRVLRIARTIADLDQCETLEVRHILEALQYRPKSPIVD